MSVNDLLTFLGMLDRCVRHYCKINTRSNSHFSKLLNPIEGGLACCNHYFHSYSYEETLSGGLLM